MPYFDFHHHKKYQTGIYNLNLFENVPNFPFSVGIHPKDLSEDAEKALKWLKKTSQNENCLAIGECGLDGLISIDEKLQESVFKQQILWANDIQKPMIIHCVRRFSQLLRFKKMSNVPMVIHGFNKSKNVADEMMDGGFYLSFGKAALHNVSLQQILKEFSIEKLFLETDDADFDISELYQKVSEIKNISVESLQNQILKNLETITDI